LAVAIVVAIENNIEKKSKNQNFMKHPNVTFSEKFFFILRSPLKFEK
jgi:hypothetical protein